MSIFARFNKNISLALTLTGLIAAAPATAGLTTFQTYTGNIGYSADGFGSTTQMGTISADVPAGSTVIAAYLYTSIFGFNPTLAGGTLNGTVVAYGPAVIQPPSNFLAMRRADVTSIVKAVIDGGPGGVYNFNVTEDDPGQDGEALVVVYRHPSLPVATFAILDGVTLSLADTSVVNFGDPLDPTDPDFFAEMFLGIGFSYNDPQHPGPPFMSSTVTVNGTDITERAGNFDDSVDAAGANGNLITVGGWDDPVSPFLPTIDNDHERYNIEDQISLGDTSITIGTANPSEDDNIFLAGFYVQGAEIVEQVVVEAGENSEIVTAATTAVAEKVIAPPAGEQNLIDFTFCIAIVDSKVGRWLVPLSRYSNTGTCGELPNDIFFPLKYKPIEATDGQLKVGIVQGESNVIFEQLITELYDEEAVTGRHLDCDTDRQRAVSASDHNLLNWLSWLPTQKTFHCNHMRSARSTYSTTLFPLKYDGSGKALAFGRIAKIRAQLYKSTASCIAEPTLGEMKQTARQVRRNLWRRKYEDAQQGFVDIALLAQNGGEFGDFSTCPAELNLGGLFKSDGLVGAFVVSEEILGVHFEIPPGINLPGEAIP